MKKKLPHSWNCVVSSCAPASTAIERVLDGASCTDEPEQLRRISETAPKTHQVYRRLSLELETQEMVTSAFGNIPRTWPFAHISLCIGRAVFESELKSALCQSRSKTRAPISCLLDLGNG